MNGSGNSKRSGNDNDSSDFLWVLLGHLFSLNWIARPRYMILQVKIGVPTPWTLHLVHFGTVCWGFGRVSGLSTYYLPCFCCSMLFNVWCHVLLGDFRKLAGEVTSSQDVQFGCGTRKSKRKPRHCIHWLIVIIIVAIVIVFIVIIYSFPIKYPFTVPTDMAMDPKLLQSLWYYRESSWFPCEHSHNIEGYIQVSAPSVNQAVNPLVMFELYRWLASFSVNCFRAGLQP